MKTLNKVTGYEILEDCRPKRKTMCNKLKDKLEQCIRVILAITFLLIYILLIISSFISIFDINQTLWLIRFLIIIAFCLLGIAVYELK